MNRLVILVCFALACASNPPKPAPSESDSANSNFHATVVSDKTEAAVREAVLSNGLRILIKEDHAAPVATFVVYYKVGSRNEHVGITGSAHLLEHLQFKGTKHFPGRAAVWGGLSRIGASFNATTFYDRTNFFETVPVDKLPFAIALEADRMRNSTFTDADRASEMPVVRNELERDENSPGNLLQNLLWAESIVAHPYHHPVIGWRSDVENVPTSELRHFYDTYYQPDDAVIACVGDFKSNDVLKMIVDDFGIYPGGHTFPPVYTTEPPQHGERRFVIEKPGELALVELGWKLPPATDPDVVPLKVLQLVLAGTLNINEFGDPLDSGISNRLYQSLVEKQLATGVGFDYTLMIDPGIASLTASVRPGVTHQAVEDALLAQIKRLQDEPVSPEELARAKKRARAAFGLSLDGTFGQAMALGYFGLISHWQFVGQFADKVDQVTAADVQRVAKKWFPKSGLTVGWFVPTNPDEPGAANGQTRSDELSAPMRATLRQVDDYAEAKAVTARAVAAEMKLDGSNADPTAQIQKKTLPNGLRIIVQENPSSPTVAIAGSVLAGSVHEKPDELGLAGITSEMIQRGTTKHSKLELARELEDVGASFGLGDGFESIDMSGLALSEDLSRMFDVMSEELLSPSFPPDELEKLKNERIAQVQQAEDSTGVRGRRALMQAIYPKGDPRYIDNPEDVIAAFKGMNVDKVRDWYRRFYGPDRTIITVVGNVKAADVFSALESRLGSWQKVGGPPVSAPDIQRRPSAGEKIVFMPDKSNVDIFLGETSDLNHLSADYYPAMMANYVLGGGVSGQLFRHVRNELGLTYGIGSSISSGKIAGPWTISLTVNPKAVTPALGAVHDVLTKWEKDGASDAELADAKNAIVGLFKVGLATNSGLASVLNQYETLGLGADFVREHPKRIEAVTRDEVLQAIHQKFAPDVLYTVVSGTVEPAK